MLMIICVFNNINHNVLLIYAICRLDYDSFLPSSYDFSV